MLHSLAVALEVAAAPDLNGIATVVFASVVVLVIPAALSWAANVPTMSDLQMEEERFVRSGSAFVSGWSPFPLQETASCIPYSFVHERVPKRP